LHLLGGFTHLYLPLGGTFQESGVLVHYPKLWARQILLMEVMNDIGVFSPSIQEAMPLNNVGASRNTRNIRTGTGVLHSVALTDEEKQRIREEEMIRLMAREEYQSRRRHRTLAPIAILTTCVVVAALIFAFTILRSV